MSPNTLTGFPDSARPNAAVGIDPVVGSTETLYSGPEHQLVERFDEWTLPEEAFTKTWNLDPKKGDLEVHVTSDLTLEDYKAITPPDEWERLLEYAREMQGKTVARVNATAAGGGVAIMNAPWVHLMRELGVDAHWYAMDVDEEAAEVTKWKFHNVLQDVAPEGTELTDQDIATYEGMIARNVEMLREPLSQADVVIIDDWQPSRLIPYLKGFEEKTGDGSVYHLPINADAPIMFRDHIHTEGDLMVTPGTPQHRAWQYLWEQNQISRADVFVAHPRDEFVPENVPNERVVFMPATIDRLDDLNRELTPREKQYGRAFINAQLALHEGQQPLDFDRPYIALIARFDESKGMPQAIESYAKARQQMLERGVPEAEIPQLAIMGNGSKDDPSGKTVLKEIMTLRDTAGMLDPELYGDIKDAIKVARLPHNDIAINALLRDARVALQPSIAEGFEARVSDAIWQGVPVIGSDRGGIPLQIVEGQSGYILDPYDTDAWAHRLVQLAVDTKHYETLRRTTAEMAKSHNQQFTTTSNVTRWLLLGHALLQQETDFHGDRRWAEELAQAA